MTQVTESVDKDIKTIITTVLRIFKKLEERLTMLSRDMEDIHITQKNILEIKTIVSEMKKIHEMRLITDKILQKKRLINLMT